MWADEVWFALTDRDGSYFGRLAEEGTFQRFNPLMDPEYELDVRTGLFTSQDDSEWVFVRRGLRVAGASISHPFILNRIDWREEIPVGGKLNLRARYHRHRSLTAQRDYTRLGLLWREVGGSSWNLETGLGIHFFKPSADLEVVAGRRWGTAGESFQEVEIRVTALDAFSNMIFKGLGVAEEEVEAHFDYATPAVATRFAFRRRSALGLLEVHGGVSNRSRVRVTFPASGEVPYTLFERVGFAGVLAEVTPTPSLAIAAFATWARAETDRVYDIGGEGDIILTEETRIAGFRQRVATSHGVSLDLELTATWRPEERSGTEAMGIDHRDREIFGLLALTPDPSPGFDWRLALAAMDRDAGTLASHLSAANVRNVMEWGYRFSSGFHVMAGLRWDLDRFPRDAFDGGHLRISSSW
jgi:hypothetical protein